MVDDDLGLRVDGVLVVLDVLTELFLGPLGIELWVVVDALDHVEIPVHRRVVAEHVHDEALLDGLLHRVGMEGQVLDRAICLLFGRYPENLQGLVLRRRRECEVRGVGQELLCLDDPVDLVLEGVIVLVVVFLGSSAEGLGHGARGLSSLAGMGLVDDDGETAVLMVLADVVQDERELLDGGDDDFLALLDEPRRSPELSACPTVLATWVNCLMVLSICRSSTTRSVMTMMESNAGFPSWLRP